jgi:murein DD-endopeptidase MepM/ murein hydrolase activator NlpD
VLARSEWTHGRVPVARAPAGFGARRRRRRLADLQLAIDLNEDFGSRRWWRGFATLTALTVATALMAPPFSPLPGGHPAAVGEPEERQFAATGVGALIEGSEAGIAMAPTAAVEPIANAPERATLDLFARVAPGETLAALLVRLGATYGDAGQAQALLATTRIAPGTTVEVTLGRKTGSLRPVERVSLRTGLDSAMTIVASPTGLALQRQAIALDTTPLRIRGRVGDGLYWSLRAAGVASDTAEEYLKALSTQLDVGSQVAPDDRFDLVVANRRAATGESEAGPLLYAGLERSAGSTIQLIKWTTGGTSQWYDGAGAGRQVSGMVWPVNAPITSGFGERYHPILHFMRMHKGIDFGAHYGTPIVAAADGTVERAGWAGGYGEQVRLAHAGGIETSYSHMSRFVVGAGSTVRQGQLIGYSGSSGLSTGPHLHYEVMRGGQAINPMSVRFIAHSTIDGPSLAAFKARVAALLSVGAKG